MGDREVDIKNDFSSNTNDQKGGNLYIKTIDFQS